MLKHPKRPRDPFAIAVEIGQELTGERPKKPPPPSSTMAERGRKGGLKGGNARARALPKKRRSEIAKRAAKARWSR